MNGGESGSERKRNLLRLKLYKTVSTIKVCSINFEPPAESPWTMQSQRNYGSFLSKSHLDGMILLTMLAQKVKDNALIELFAISRLSISNRGKQLRYVWDHVANVNIESSLALKEKKAHHTH